MATRSSRKNSLGGGDGSPSDGDSNWLPDGWRVEFKARKSGYNKGKRYKCYVDSQGHKCYSKSQVLAYLEKIRTDNANRSSLDLSMEPESEVVGSSPGELSAKRATRSSKRKSLAMQGAEGVSAGESGSSSVNKSVVLPWTVFCYAVRALYYRKMSEENPEDEKLKEKLEVAEKNVHLMRKTFPEDVPEGWKYNHETASNIVSRGDEDSGGELISIATALEEKINEKRNRKRNCCYKQSDRELRRFGVMLNRQWASFSKKLRVENLHFSTDEVEFTKRFEDFGPVEEVHFPKDPETGHCEGLAHIEFYKLEHAKAAAQSLNGTQMAGQTIKIESYADHLKALPQGAKAAGLE